MYIILGIIITYFLYNNICIYGKNKKSCPYKFNQIKFNQNNKIHIHHWLIHLILLIIIYLFNFNFNINLINFIIGLNIGGIIHGITEYDDWYIIYKN